MKTKQNTAIFWAILSAAPYAISIPVSKILLKEIPPTMMASLLYLGAGIGMSIIWFVRSKKDKLKSELNLTKKEMPYTVGMVLINIVAAVFLMIGLDMTTSSTASLLSNFEIVATSVIALLSFKEAISKRLWFAIGLITVASILLSVKDLSNVSFSFGSFFILLGTICWGFENNFTRKLSVKDPLEIVIIKGFGSGLGSLILAFIVKQTATNVGYIIATLALGFVAYGLSIYLYIYAQRYLGAAKTSTYYAIAPFIGVVLSFILFFEIPKAPFFIALLIMLIGTYFASAEGKGSEAKDY
ncbi:DMT family transporter [Neobacillus terrae]|uniref:DMT family transporter n=1 Tax=Neobacillus terrae TaxID=3034837 RepID=UPI0014096176|nr:DMT family transporter [Neobacillus terrae]NHM33808.1 DMT family transporter [Neobacillus terrae]